MIAAQPCPTNTAKVNAVSGGFEVPAHAKRRNRKDRRNKASPGGIRSSRNALARWPDVTENIQRTHREARNAFAHQDRSVQQRCIDNEVKKGDCWRCGTYLKYVMEYIFLHRRVVYPYRTAANLNSVQDDVIVLSANPSVVARVERW